MASRTVVQYNVFLSAVSEEFHRTDPDQPRAFVSYRDALVRELNALGAFRVIVQEELHQGPGDLLSTLESEVASSWLIIHLVGDKAGYPPKDAEVRRLRARRPKLLEVEPALKDAIGDGQDITYTQWELYFAYEHSCQRFVFYAEPTAPRSPLCPALTAGEAALQTRHKARIRATGEHRGVFADHQDLFIQIIRGMIRNGWLVLSPELEGNPDQLAQARAQIDTVVGQVAARIKAPDKKTVRTPAGGSIFAQAMCAVAGKWGLTESELLSLLEEDTTRRQAAAFQAPTAESLYDLAFASFALADFREAMAHSRAAADLAMAAWHEASDQSAQAARREVALNSLRLLADAAKNLHESDTAIAALIKGGALIDRDDEPDLWASYHQGLSEMLIRLRRMREAEPYVRAVVSIREADPGEKSRKARDRALPLGPVPFRDWKPRRIGSGGQSDDSFVRSAKAARSGTAWQNVRLSRGCAKSAGG